jgi:uridine kinase
MLEYAPVISAIAEKRKTFSRRRALLVGISGIDASGKGFVTAKLAHELEKRGWKVAAIGVDGWLNLPHVRFNQENPAGHFYERAFRFEEMFETLVVPLQQNREIDLHMDYTEETATSYRQHRYQFREIDVILLEGNLPLKARASTLFRLGLLGGVLV